MNNTRISLANFPAINDPDKGKKSWIKKSIKACWDDFTNIRTSSFYGGRRRYPIIKSYMLGEQDISQYKKKLNIDIANGDKSWNNMDGRVIKIGPKFRRMTIASLVGNTWKVGIKAVDPSSKDEHDEYYARNAARLELKKRFKEQGLDPSMISETDDNFRDMDDLDLYMKYSYKSRMAIEAEEMLRLVMTNNKFSNIREQQIEYLHDYGLLGYKEHFDVNGDIKIAGLDPSNVIVSICKEKDFSDAIYIGEVMDLTISDLRSMDLENEISDDEYEKIAQISGSSMGMSDLRDRFDVENYEDYRIQVLDIEFFSDKSIIIENGNNSQGNFRSSRANKVRKREGQEYKEANYKVIYKGKWVVGTTVFFDCGLQTDMKRAKNNLADTSLSYHLFAPELDNMETYSMGENYIPVLDQIQLAWYKYQDVIASAKKKGILIELTSLENIPLGKGGTQLTPIQVIDFYNKTGSVVYRRVDDSGKTSNYKPIDELNNGLGDEASRYFTEIYNCIQLLRDISGYNELTDGSTPDARTLNGVAKLASESTNKSIDFMKRADRRMIEGLSQGLMIRVQDAAKDGRLSSYARAIGKDSVKYLEMAPDVGLAELGLVIEEEPDEYQRERFSERINIAIQGNQINIADAMIVESMDNLKHAQALLALKIERNIDKQQEIAMQNQEMNAKVQQEALAMAAKAKEQELTLKAKFDSELEAQKATASQELLNKKYEWEFKIEEMKVLGSLEESKVSGVSRNYVADKTSDTKEKIEQSKSEGNKELVSNEK
jgi:hypothetical protein